MTEAKPFFSLDRRDAKLLGVCSGLGKRFGIDPTFVRVAWIAIPLLTPVSFKLAAILYVVAGVIGWFGRQRAAGNDRQGRSGEERWSVHSLRTRLDPRDRQMMAVDDHLAGQNEELAREIDALREERK
jgi:phage shock protein C